MVSRTPVGELEGEHRILRGDGAEVERRYQRTEFDVQLRQRRDPVSSSGDPGQSRYVFPARISKRVACAPASFRTDSTCPTVPGFAHRVAVDGRRDFLGEGCLPLPWNDASMTRAIDGERPP